LALDGKRAESRLIHAAALIHAIEAGHEIAPFAGSLRTRLHRR
jgi:hypothetical protein